MENPIVKKDLVESILELRAEAERRLMRNKYYVAIKKLDELLEAIRPLEAQVIEEDARHAADAGEPAALTDETAGSVEAHEHPEAAIEPQAQSAAAGGDPGLAHEFDEPATSILDEPRIEQAEPVQTEHELSVLDVSEDGQPGDESDAGGARIRPRANAAE